MFGKKQAYNQTEVLVAVKSKDWRDQKGRRKAKAGFAVGTHHGVEEKYLSQYLAEYTFRFNRRHDPGSLFFKALGACVHAKPVTSQVLFGQASKK